jgi:hypothetical protein
MKTLFIAAAALTLGTVTVCEMLAEPPLAGAARVESAFACNRLALNPIERKRHFDELGPRLRSLTQGFRELPGGYEFKLPANPPTVQLAAEWAAGEHLCCPFFDIDLMLERENGAFWLRLTGREGVKQFIKSDLAKWFER